MLRHKQPGAGGFCGRAVCHSCAAWPRPKHFDTLIVGAGAAGLVAAAELSKHRGTVCLLEARDRRRRPHVHATRVRNRFADRARRRIHSRPLARDARVAGEIQYRHRRSAGERWTLCDGKPEPADNLFEQMKRGLKSITRPRKDLPFSEFLDSVARRKLSPAARKLARALVEGFDAADATRVSTWATLDEWSGNSSADSPTFRPLGGYASLVDGLACALDPDKVQRTTQHGRAHHSLATRPSEDRSDAARSALQRASEDAQSSRCRSVCCSYPHTPRERCASCPTRANSRHSPVSRRDR